MESGTWIWSWICNIETRNRFPKIFQDRKVPFEESNAIGAGAKYERGEVWESRDK